MNNIHRAQIRSIVPVKLAILPLVMLWTASLSSAQSTIAWGSAVSGLRLGVAVDSTKAEPKLSVFIQNLGESAQNLLIGANQGRGDMYSFRFVVVAPDGKHENLEPTDAAYYSTGKLLPDPITANLTPGERREISFPALGWVCFSKTGNIPLMTRLNDGWTLQVSLEIELLLEPIKDHVFPTNLSRTGTLVTPEIGLPVKR